MSENTKIEWATHTFNPWEGCQKVGPGCDHCYAESRNARFSGGTALNWGPGAPRRRTSPANWAKPLAWNANHETFFSEHGHRQRVFCASLADVFDNEVPVQWRAELLQLIDKTPNLDWLLLTKRVGNVVPMLKDIRRAFDGAYAIDLWPRPNIWIGATVVNQEEANRDIMKLLDVPAKVRFLSMEPLLGPVDLTRVVYPAFKQKDENEPYVAYDTLRGHMIGPDDVGLPKLDWVIVGGESGTGARPMHPAWARGLRDQCEAAGVPFMFKQWGEWATSEQHGLATSGVVCRWLDNVGGELAERVGKKAAGRMLDGRTWDGIPA